MRVRLWLSLTLAGAALVILLYSYVPGASVALVDAEQELLDEPTVTLDGQHTVGQTFRAHFARLHEIDVRLVKNAGPANSEGPRALRFRLRASPDAVTDLATATYDVSALQHNDPLRFRFAPQADSAGKSYYLLVEGGPVSGVALWSSSISNYDPGSLYEDGAPKAGDLTFTALYEYDALAITADVGASLLQYGGLALPLILALFVPGFAMLLVAGFPRAMDLVDLMGISLALSLVFYPLMFLWCTAFGLSLSAPLLSAILGVLAVVAVVAGHRQRAALRAMVVNTNAAAFASFTLVLAIILILRLVNLKGLTLPLWVDSVHHAAIARLIADQGQIPVSLRPFANVDTFFYHFGFHTQVVALSWLSGINIEPAMMLLGQVLNALTCVGLYVLVKQWTGQPLAGLAAMVVAGTVSLFPAYYLTWGRYTQLAGLVILPVAMGVVQGVLTGGSTRATLVAGAIVAGLVLVHYRVTLFLATFVAAFLIGQSALAWRRRAALVALWRRALGIAFVAVLASAPWLWRLLQTVILPLATLPERLAGSEDYNAVPWDLLSAGHMPILLALAAAGATLGLWHARAHTVTILIWLALTALLINPSLFSLRPSWVINNFSAVIAVFVPLALLIGIGAGAILRLVERRANPVRFAHASALLQGGLILLALWTGRGMLSVVNPVTNLVTGDDITAIQYAREHVPHSAVFLVNARLWQQNAYVGTDGGYWIPELSGHQTTMPIAFYIYGTAGAINHVNELAATVDSGPDPDSAEFLSLLRARGVSHVYVGAKGGPLSLVKIARSPHYREIYTHGAAHIFEIQF
ncbi:MAG: hypothetical protein HYR71_02980 [Chloroflexi bacterium]|nr:hypothetical protein [Chloroflexota bacterium]